MNNQQDLNPNPESDYQSGTYSDSFEYLTPPSSANANNFNNWFWEMYPNASKRPLPVDQYLSFQYHTPANDPEYPNAICSKMTVKRNAPAPAVYQDAEIFNNACIEPKCKQSYMQPPCKEPFPNKRLDNVRAPYEMKNSSADAAAMYLPNKQDGGKNTPYYPSNTVAYSIKMRIKADGFTFGTRGWGFWNTIMHSQGTPYFAWFWEFGVQFDLSDSTDNSKTPHVIPVAMTAGSEGVEISLLINVKGSESIDFYQWNDYQIIWGQDQVNYYVNNVLVAVHTFAPPIGKDGGGMAYHCWVDNRLFTDEVQSNGNPYLPIILPIDKTNSMQSFKAEPYTDPIPSGQPKYPTYSYKNKGVGFQEIASKVNELYLQIKSKTDSNG